MKQPPGTDLAAEATTHSLEDLASAVRAGRLVGLLKASGLTRDMVEELVWPESALRLKAILADHVLPEGDQHAGEKRCDGDSLRGNLLVFRRKKRYGS